MCLAVVLLVMLMSGVVLGNQPSADERLGSWDQGLSLMDEGRLDDAAEHLHPLLRKYPRRLELLEACLRLEQRRSPADSVLPRVAGLISGSFPSRFLASERRSRQGDFSAAADSFRQLAVECREKGDPLSALTAAHKMARCWLDDGGPPDASRLPQQLQTFLEAVPVHPRLEAENRFFHAGFHYQSDQLDQAEELARFQLEEASRNGYRAMECDALNILGGIMAKRRRLVPCLDYYEQGVRSARRSADGQRLCQLLINLGYQKTQGRMLAEARRDLEEADSLARGGGWSRFQGSIQAGLGAVAEVAGNRPEAVERFREAIILSQQSGNQLSEIGARQRLAYNLSTMGHYAEARDQLETCLALLEANGARFLLNWVLANLALTSHKLGYLDQATEYYQRAHAVNLAMDDRMSAAWCLNSLGLIQALRGNYRQALVTHHQALEQYQALGDGEGVGEARVGMAEVYLRLGDFHQALQQGKAAMTQAETAGSEELLRQAAHILAATYSATDQSVLAKQHYQQVLEIARRWDDRAVEIWALNGLAEHLLDQGHTPEARLHLKDALGLMEGQGYPHVRSLTCLLLARAASTPAAALDWAEQARAYAVDAGLPDREWEVLTDLGWYRHQLGDQEQAVAMQQRSMELVESLRRRAGTDELRRQMLRPALKPYERLIQLFTQDAGAAFTISERSRAQILAGRLQSAQVYGGQGKARTTDPEERNLSATITFLQSRLQEASLSQALRDSLREQVNLLENDFSLLKLRWSAGDEQEARVLYPAPPQLASLQSVLAENEHLLSYFLGQKQAYLFSVTRHQVKAFPLGAAEVIRNKVRLFLRLQKHADNPQGTPPGVLLAARQELYSLLVAPAQQDMEPRKNLIIIPDGLLHRLPFAYLHDGRAFLIEKYSLFYTPSLQVLGYLRQRQQTPPRKGVVAIACADETQRLHPFHDAAITGLPGAEEEVRRLGELFDGALILSGSAASEEEIGSGVLASADIIHFAAHGYADEADFRHSYLVLNPAAGDTVQPISGKQDGLLQWNEIVNLDLNASLVTLASCRSAGGPLTVGEGITGLTQAFLHAGSRGVLATLTDVPDQNTARVMDRFYDQLSRGATAAAALRNAQLEGLKQGLEGAEFVLVGDGALTHEGGRRQDRSTVVLLAVVICLGLCLALGLVRVLRTSHQKIE